MEVDTSITALRVTRVLDRIAAERGGYPKSIVLDHGPEFISRELDQWAHRHGVKLDFIDRGKPVQNCFIESFNGRVREECLNLHWFADLADARRTIAGWQREYNEERSMDPSGRSRRVRSRKRRGTALWKLWKMQTARFPQFPQRPPLPTEHFSRLLGKTENSDCAARDSSRARS